MSNDFIQICGNPHILYISFSIFSMASQDNVQSFPLLHDQNTHFSGGTNGTFFLPLLSLSFFFFHCSTSVQHALHPKLFVQWMNKTKMSKPENSGSYKHLWFHLHMWFHIQAIAFPIPAMVLQALSQDIHECKTSLPKCAPGLIF